MLKIATGIFIGLLMTTCIQLSAQSTRSIHARYKTDQAKATNLTIGDKVPDFHFSEVMNYSSPTADLSAFRAKLTILDFWSTSCSSCIALFPHMQALKEKFGDDLQIVLVNGKTQVWHDTQEKINYVLQRQKQQTGKTISLPIILNSTEVDTAFPWRTVPHEVWINQQGQIIGITGPSEVNEANISGILNGKDVNMHLKKDATVDLGTTPLQDWLYGPSDPSHPPIVSSTIWQGFLDGLNGNGIRTKVPGSNKYLTGWYAVNMPAFDIILTAYTDVIRVPANQVILDIKEPARLPRFVPFDSAYYTQVYSYDITTPPIPYTQLLKFVQQDISRALNVSLQNTRQPVNCLIVKAKNVPRSPAGEAPDWAMETTYENKYIHNYPLNQILDVFNEYSAVPIVNETGITYNIDIDMPNDLRDVKQVKACLRRAGFELMDEQRILDVVVISDLY